MSQKETENGIANRFAILCRSKNILVSTNVTRPAVGFIYSPIQCAKSTFAGAKVRGGKRKKLPFTLSLCRMGRFLSCFLQTRSCRQFLHCTWMCSPSQFPSLWITNCMELRPSERPTVRSPTQKLPAFYGIRRYVAVLTTARGAVCNISLLTVFYGRHC
jgi:hypothetical protein